MTHGNNTLGGWVLKITRLQQTLTVAFSLGVPDPDRLLGIIDLSLVLPLHFDGGQEEFSWVGVGLTRLR